MARPNVVVAQPYVAGLVPTLILVANRSKVPRRYQPSLEQNDYYLIWARTVKAAAALSRERPPDLVILDIDAPSHGLRQLGQIRADPHLGSIPLVLLGAFSDMVELRHGLELGACDYLIGDETSPSLLARRARSWLADAAKPAPSRASLIPTAVDPLLAAGMELPAGGLGGGT